MVIYPIQGLGDNEIYMAYKLAITSWLTFHPAKRCDFPTVASTKSDLLTIPNSLEFLSHRVCLTFLCFRCIILALTSSLKCFWPPTSSYWMTGCFYLVSYTERPWGKTTLYSLEHPPLQFGLYTNNKIDLKCGSSWENWYKARISFDVRILVVVCDNTHLLCASYGLRDGNTRQPDLPPEKSVCRSRSNS